jgi:hypothetical protein
MQERAAVQSRAPTLRRYAAMSLLLQSMAQLSGDFPLREQESYNVQNETRALPPFSSACTRLQGGHTDDFLRSHQLLTRPEIDKPRQFLQKKSNGADTVLYESKNVTTSKIKTKAA